MCEIDDHVYINTSKNDIIEEIESLYPNVFKPADDTLLSGNVIFSIK